MADESKDQVILLGREHLPDEGALIIPSSLSFHDLLLLEEQWYDRPVTYLIEETGIFDPLLQAHLEKDGVEALEFAARDEYLDAFRTQLEELSAEGGLIVFVPGKSAAHVGAFTTVPSGTLAYLLRAGVPTLPLFVDHPDATRLSIEPRPKEPTLVFSFGPVVKERESPLPAYLESLFLANRTAFEGRRILDQNLAYSLLLGLKKHGSAARVINGEDGSEHRFDKLLAIAIVLSKIIRARTSKPRVGIILPPCFPALVANLGTLFAGKTPVNLNFTASESAAVSSMEQADLDLYITVDPFVRKTQRFPWPPNRQMIFLERVLPTKKKQIVAWLLASKLLPAGVLANSLGIPRRGGDEEALLLFTSGSSGDPKGVVLTHRNLLANVTQFSSRLRLHSQDSALGCLPLFHSFGCTVTMWYPIIEGVNLVTHPNPIETKKLASFIEQYQISLVVATPTFLRGYLKNATAEQFQSVKLVVTGAEKLPLKLAEQFEEKIGKPVLEGYGLTETSPVTNVNLPDPEPEDERLPVIPSRRLGSVGHFIPGMAVRITDPEEGTPLPLDQTGMIWLSGPNIFKEYLHQPEKTREVIVEDWLRTGDIGRVDEDGFLYIDGRISRFSKIGGEMVPHETVEDAIQAELGIAHDDERQLAVVGLPDEAKGESLVLLSVHEGLDPTDLRYRLLERGLPALWIPRQIVELREIPHLASGKLDLKRCQDIAREG